MDPCSTRNDRFTTAKIPSKRFDQVWALHSMVIDHAEVEIFLIIAHSDGRFDFFKTGIHGCNYKKICCHSSFFPGFLVQGANDDNF